MKTMREVEIFSKYTNTCFYFNKTNAVLNSDFALQLSLVKFKILVRAPKLYIPYVV